MYYNDIIHALQILATYMPQYHKILPREKMGILVYIKFMSPLKFECDYNTLMYLEREILCPTPSVLQIAATIMCFHCNNDVGDVCKN